MTKPPVLSPVMTLVMAAASGVGVANIYYNQPLLGIITADLPASPLIGLIPTATQLGYAAGLLLLVPLGDLADRKRLIVGQFAALGLVLALAALAPSAGALVIASVLVGAAATVAQQIVPFAATLARPETRGQVIGTVMAGLLCGILLSRTLAGFIGSEAGWRAVFWSGVPLALVVAIVLAFILPTSPATGAGLRYGDALRSLGTLWRQERLLRQATGIQAGLFASFSAFWTILALHLQEPALHLGADVAGLFGVLGAAGVMVAPMAGRLADRYGPHRVIGAGAVLAVAAWAVMGLWSGVAGLILGVLLLDCGIHGALVSNQHVIYALRPEARNRLNTIFMTGMFLGGSVGSAAAMAVWAWGGWNAVSDLGAGLALGVLAFRVFGRR